MPERQQIINKNLVFSYSGFLKCLPVLLLASIYLTGLASNSHSEVIQESLDYFKKDQYSLGDIVYFSSLSPAGVPDSLFNTTGFQDFSPTTERVMSFRSRFTLPITWKRPVKQLFERAKTFNNLNRKTKFTKNGSGLSNSYQADRSSFLFDITFDMTVELSEQQEWNAQKLFFMKNTGIQGEPFISISQRMTNYSRFISQTEFHFAIYPLSESTILIEAFGWSGLQKDIPDFIQRKMANDNVDKLIHFKSALSNVLEQYQHSSTSNYSILPITN